jgi:hypothetical protein
MDEDKKRILFIIGFVTLTLIFGYTLYSLFFAPDPSPYQPPTTEVTPQQEFPTAIEGQPIEGIPPTGLPTELPSAEITEADITAEKFAEQQQRINQIVTNPINNFNINARGEGVFYDNIDNQFYKTINGTTQKLDENIFYNVETVSWSPRQDEVIIEYPDGSNIYYNFETKKQVTLPKHWEEFSFSESGNQIAAKSIGLSPENRWLISSDPDGKNLTQIEPLGNNADKVIVDWSPNNQIVAMSLTGEPLGADRQELLFVGLNGENYQSTVIEGRGLVTEWSNDGNKLLYSVYSSRSDYKPELWIVNSSPNTIGTERKLLNLNTWADKCAFSSDRYIYCGVPIGLDTGAGFAPELADTLEDQIFRIDTISGASTEIQTDQFVIVDSMHYNEKDNTLFFTDKVSDGVFEITL